MTISVTQQAKSSNSEFNLNPHVDPERFAGIGGGGGGGGDSGGFPPTEPKKPFIKQLGGIGLALVASVLFSTVLVLAKLIQESGYPASEATFWRYLGVFVPSIPLLMFFECAPSHGWWGCCCKNSVNKKLGGDQESQDGGNNNNNNNNEKIGEERKEMEAVKRISVFHNIWPLKVPENRKNAIGLVLRGIFGAGAVLLRFSALNYITIGDTAVISFGSPVIVTILAHFILKERTGIVPIVVALSALMGVVIISRPPIITGEESFNTQTLIGTGMAFGSLICSAFNTILGRKIRSVQFAVQLLIFGGVGVVQSLIIAMAITGATFTLPSDWQDLLLMLGIAAFAFFAQLSMVLALKLETAAIVSLVRSCDVIFGFIVQFIVFAVAPDLYSYLGASIILSGVLLSAFRKYLETLPTTTREEGGEGSRLRKIFGFLLR